MASLLSWFWVEDTTQDTPDLLRVRLLVLPTKNTSLDTQNVISTVQDAIDYIVGITNDTSCTATVNSVEPNSAKLHLFLTHDPDHHVKIKQKVSLFITYLASALSLQLEMKVLVVTSEEVTFKAQAKDEMITNTNPKNVLTQSRF